MQLALNLSYAMHPTRRVFPNSTWTDFSLEGRGIGFTQKVEVSHSLQDALAPLQTEDEEDYEQRLYDAIWMAHHQLCLDQQFAFSFTFDFLRENLTKASLRLHVEVRGSSVLLGLPQDF
jgi:hypothetical protein